MDHDAGAAAQLVDTSLYEVALNWVPYQLVGVLATGIAPGPLGSGISILAPYEALRTRDGRLMIAAGNDRLFAALCRCLDLPSLVDDERFRTNADRVQHRGELARLLEERLLTDSSSTWEKRIRGAGVPVAPIRDLAGVVSDAQTAALDILPELPHPSIPDLRVVAPPISVGDERLAFDAPPPGLGEHTVDALRDAGYTGEEIERLVDAGAAACA